MKKRILLAALYLGATASVFAQWTTNGNNVTTDKNIGIGITTPTVKLDVNGDAKVNILHLNTLNPGENYRVSKISYLGHSLRVGSAAGSYAHNVFDLMAEGAVQGTVHTALGMYITPKIGEYIRKVLIHSSGNSYFNGGNVGIGTDNPIHKLDVNGVIRAKEIKVEADWADFVFDKDYKLPTLQEVETHINEYKHLPNIPSEKQVKEEGVNIGEMQAKLLQKIEELTLYVIEQDKTINEQNRRMNELEKKVNNQ